MNTIQKAIIYGTALATLALGGCGKESTRYQRVADYFRQDGSIQIPNMNEHEGRITGRVEGNSLTLGHGVTESELVDQGIDGIVDQGRFYVGNDHGKGNGTRAFLGLNPRKVGAQAVYEAMVDAVNGALPKK